VEMAGSVPKHGATAERFPGVQIDVLGPFAVRVDGRAVAPREFGGRLARRLVRVLAASPGRVVTRDVLIEALWGADRPADPDANLNVLVNRARKALSGAIDTTDRGYRLPASVVVDADLFQDSVAAGDGEAALALWHGEPLPQDAYEEWAQPVRHRLERRHQDALELAAASAFWRRVATRPPPSRRTSGCVHGWPKSWASIRPARPPHCTSGCFAASWSQPSNLGRARSSAGIRS
jgi:two-component SAPR family response regulator